MAGKRGRSIVSKPTATSKIQQMMTRTETENENRKLRVYKAWARNPYAFAESIVLSPAYQKKYTEFKDGKKFLDRHLDKHNEVRENLQRILGRKYNEIFNLTPKSKIYNINVQKAPPLPSGGCVGTHWGTYPNTVNPAPFFNGSYALQAQVDDPIQGCQPDCYVFAALCSAAWSIPNWVPNIPNPPFTITLFERGQGAVQKSHPTREIVLDASTLPVFGRPTPNSSWNIGISEIWPAVYEVAYALLKGFPSSALPSDANNGNPNPAYPDLSYFTTYNNQGHGDPLEALYNFTGLDYSPSTQFNMSNYNPQNDQTTVFNIIDGISGGTYTNPITRQVSKRTLKPAVAWTYQDASHAPDTTIIYEDTVLVEKHCYSVLGTYQSSRTDGQKKYIILRNPWGSVWGWTNDKNDPRFTNALDPRLRTATVVENWTPQNYAARPLSFYEGIFALNMENFIRYYAGFGYVQ
jgi:hypothetical protein